ncbi:MAG TPA: LysM peptidoglycan-binding domain-containing protein [Mobilitalea sp.]|nr:LysM peptidoglycan-binding domain-containing protein [Mobilitalea sp.]
MTIHVVQPEENIYYIADKYDMLVEKLIRDNDLAYPYDLVAGQTVVIAKPVQTHTVQEGDTLESIAKTYGITVMQLLRNNPFLTGREYIYPGETLAIRYDTKRDIITNGYTYPYINSDVLKKTLPNLTYLTIFNYSVVKEGEMIAYEDESKLIQLSLEYGTIPLMLTTTLSASGEPNIEIGYDIMLNEEYQERHIKNTLNILKNKGYHGINMVFNYMNVSNQKLYRSFITKISKVLREEGYLFFITINEAFRITENGVDYDKVDYTGIDQEVDGIIILHFAWGTNTEAPAPVISNNHISEFIKYLLTFIPPDKLSVGIPVIGYEWELPYVIGRSRANSMTIGSSISLAHDVSADILFDDVSQTPYFNYLRYSFGNPSQYRVWFLDARTINADLQLVDTYHLGGIGIWNIMVYYAQMWLIINSQYDTKKLLPVI